MVHAARVAVTVLEFTISQQKDDGLYAKAIIFLGHKGASVYRMSFDANQMSNSKAHSIFFADSVSNKDSPLNLFANVNVSISALYNAADWSDFRTCYGATSALSWLSALWRTSSLCVHT